LGFPYRRQHPQVLLYWLCPEWRQAV
jgi:hypothetical protein